MRMQTIAAVLLACLGISCVSLPNLVQNYVTNQANPNLRTIDSVESDHSVFLPLILKPIKSYLPLVIHSSIAPSEPFPLNFAREVSANTYLTWQFQHAYLSTSYRYNLYFDSGTDHPTTLIASNSVDSWYELATLEEATTYSWQVVAIDSGTDVRYPGPIWQFTTETFGVAPLLDEVVSVPAGAFWMGCDRANRLEDRCSYNLYHRDEPVRRVTVDSFQIDKYEVTNQEYLLCAAEGACSLPRRTEMLYDPAYALSPVVYVSWWDAQAYCSWEGKRLPTEAEWEKSARGVIDTRKWPWGNEAPDCTRVNHWPLNRRDEGCSIEPQRDVQQIGLHPHGASPYGVHDMAGNVFEWVQDKYDVNYYLYAPLNNPQGPPFSRVTKDFESPDAPPSRNQTGLPVFTVRGGSWRFDLTYLRVAHRHWGHHGYSSGEDVPYFRNNAVGFRCAASVP